MYHTSAEQTAGRLRVDESWRVCLGKLQVASLIELITFLKVGPIIVTSNPGRRPPSLPPVGPRDPPRICALRGSACCTPEAGIPSRCARTTRTMQRITLPSSALRKASSLTRACLRAIRTVLSTLLDMGRYTGVGMPRAKKAKPAPAPAPPPAPPTPAQPPDPPPTPPKPNRIVAPESPSKTQLLRAQRLARITAKKKAAESKNWSRSTTRPTRWLGDFMTRSSSALRLSPWPRIHRASSVWRGRRRGSIRHLPSFRKLATGSLVRCCWRARRMSKFCRRRMLARTQKLRGCADS